MRDNKRAGHLLETLDQLYLELEEAQANDAPAHIIHDLREAIKETEHALMFTGHTK